LPPESKDLRLLLSLLILFQSSPKAVILSEP
jgi:hypothetical protein